MLFGQSVFQSVLERLKAEEETEEAEVPAAHRVQGLSSGLAFDVMEGVSAASQRIGEAYFDNIIFPAETAVPKDPVLPPEPEPEPVMPAYLTHIMPQEIADELAISLSDTLQSLGEKRRTFAKANHPDSVAPLFRENATKRMTLANHLIDEAIRRLSR